MSVIWVDCGQSIRVQFAVLSALHEQRRKMGDGFAEGHGVKAHSRVRLVGSRGGMTNPAERLRIARMGAGFSTGKEAAEALGFPVSTYLGHENGSRGISASRAVTYARKYKVREQWLLYGVGPGPGSETDGEMAEIGSIVDRLPPLRRAEALKILRVLSGDTPA